MKTLLLLLLCLGVCTPAFAQTLYNPTVVAFESADHATISTYKVEFWVSGAPLTGEPVQAAFVPVSKIVVGAAGPPITYWLYTKDIPIFLPFGKSYVLRLLACADVLCSVPSEVTRETIRYNYCVTPTNTIQPMTLVQNPSPTNAVVGGYSPITVTITSLKPVHSVSIALMGSGGPAFYFTGVDLRGAQTYTIGPLVRAGRFLMNIYAADEAGCSVSQGSLYITVR
jgi:hypothetical protein